MMKLKIRDVFPSSQAQRLYLLSNSSKLFFMFMLCGALPADAQENVVHANQNNISQNQILTHDELAHVLQLCLNKTEIHAFLPKNEMGEFKPVYLMQYPIAVPNGINLTIKGMQVALLEKTVKPNVDAYFMVRNISKKEGSLMVNLNLFIKNNQGAFEMKNIFGEFNKNTELVWSLKDLIIKQL